MESNFEWITANGDIGIRFFHSIDDGGYSNPPHWHNDLEIIYLLEGRLKVRFGDGGGRRPSAPKRRSGGGFALPRGTGIAAAAAATLSNHHALAVCNNIR